MEKDPHQVGARRTAVGEGGLHRPGLRAGPGAGREECERDSQNQRLLAPLVRLPTLY